MFDEYAYWRAALAGDKQPIHENEPHVGFWAKRQKAGPRLPVAIWRGEHGLLVALVGFDGSTKVVDAGELWTWVVRDPVTEEEYRAAFAAGAWPSDPPAVQTAPTSDGEQRPNSSHADPAEALRVELDGESELATEFLAAPISTDADADRAAIWAKRLGDLSKRADGHRETEKAPHLEAGRAVDAKWKPIVDGAKELSTRLKRHVEPFLIEKKRIEDEKRRKAEEEARRLRDEAERAAREAAANDEAAQRAAADAVRKAQEAERAAEAKVSTNAGRTGAKVALRTERRARIIDYAAAHLALRDHPEMKALVEQLANRAVRAGVALAGVEAEEFQKAA
jgi:hypothetical protein